MKAIKYDEELNDWIEIEEKEVIAAKKCNECVSFKVCKIFDIHKAAITETAPLNKNAEDLSVPWLCTYAQICEHYQLKIKESD